MRDIIKEIEVSENNQTKIKYSREICPKKPQFVRKSVFRQITNSETHEVRALSRKKEHDDLVKILRDMKEQNKNKRSHDAQNAASNRSYLEFLAFCMKENLSSLGKFLQKIAKKKELSFLSRI